MTLVFGGGEELTQFTIHRNILCQVNPFLQAAYKPEWMKTEDEVIKLLANDTQLIQMMIYWLYNEICFAKHALSWGRRLRSRLEICLGTVCKALSPRQEVADATATRRCNIWHFPDPKIASIRCWHHTMGLREHVR